TQWGVSSFQSRRWQQELTLCCSLPDLTPQDAHILVRSGILSVTDLAASDPRKLFREVQRTLSSTGASRTLFPRYSRGRIEDFVRGARVQRRGIRSARKQQAPARGPSQGIKSNGVAGKTLHPEPTTRRLGKSLRRRAIRGVVPQSLPTGSSTMHELPRSTDETRRFHLNPTDTIVGAPAIGPRLAERLRSIGVSTIAQLFAADAATLAGRLALRDVRPETVLAWQAQAALVCRVPQLRGHDARILVATGIREPDQLARMSTEELWNVVLPFLGTRECQRILRGGPLPDVAEVGQWIEWARHARALHAA
ncbi:MAG TPA: DUF4332 domain-containing protein, partial [Pirellulaceae bacterium]